MALNSEQMRQLRRERAIQREKKAASRRKLIFRLSMAAAVLVFCGLVIYVTGSHSPGIFLSETQGTEAPTAVPTTVPPATQPSGTGETAPKEAVVIHLAMAGDVNVTDRSVSPGPGGFTDTFMDVVPLLAQADLTALNFEGVLCNAPYGTESKSAPQSLMDALSRAGVDLVQLANSYSIYSGTSGLASTISGVSAANMEPMGTYRDSQDYEARKGYTIREVKGIKIAFVAFTKGMDGMALPAGSEKCVNVLYEDYDSAYQKVDGEKIRELLDRVNREKPDLTVAMLHWGSEFNDTISKSQKRIVDIMKEEGVDAIIGTHSHYVQSMSLDPESGMFTAYSLGDFYGDADRAGSEYSVVLDLEITKQPDGHTSVTGFSYTPIFTVAEEGRPLRVVRIREAMAAFEGNFISRVSKSTYDKMAYALDRIEDRVTAKVESD